jgi:hypothetical protein
LVVWVFLPEDDGDWRPYTFDEELAALEAKRAIPDEENAARIYKEIFEQFSDVEFPKGEVFDSGYRTAWLSKDNPEHDEFVRKHEDTIEKALEAAKFERCYFPAHINWYDFWEERFGLSVFRQLAYLLVISANNDMAEGRINQALEKSRAIFQLGKHVCQQPTMVEMMVGHAVKALAVRQFKELVLYDDITEEQLDFARKTLRDVRYDWRSDWPRMLDGEKLFMISALGPHFEINTEGKVRLSRDRKAIFRKFCPEEMPPATYRQKKLAKAGTIFVWFFFPSTPQKVAKIIDAAFEKYYPMAEQDFDRSKEPRKMLPSLTEHNFSRFRFDYRYLIETMAGMSEEVFYGVRDIYIRTMSNTRAALLIIALRHHKNETGHWPESLDQISDSVEAETLIDPINGDSFVYKLTPENFTLYSKGKNNIDEGGEHDAVFDPNSFEMKVNVDDWLFWPPRSRKAKEENTDVEQQ